MKRTHLTAIITTSVLSVGLLLALGVFAVNRYTGGVALNLVEPSSIEVATSSINNSNVLGVSTGSAAGVGQAALELINQ